MCNLTIVLLHDIICREKNLIVKEIIGLSVGEVVLPVGVGVIFHSTKPYSLLISLFVMALIIFGLHFYIDHLIEVKPAGEAPGGDARTEPLLEDGPHDQTER